MKKESKIEKIIDRTIDLIYSRDKRSIRFLFLLTFIGFILRLIGALNLEVLADDMVFASQSAGIIDSKILSTHSNPILFFYLTDLAYKIFGFTTLASRFWPLIAGTLLIPLVFLITRKFFSERIALFSALFVTFSSFLIRMTFSEQSLVVLFFSMFATYMGIMYLDKRRINFLIVSGSLFGLAFLTKYNAPFFLTSFLIFSMYYVKSKKQKIFTKNNLKHFIILAAIIFAFSLPIFSFNYFIYNDKGILDVYFSRVINLDKTQEIYGTLAGQENSFFNNLFNIENYGNYSLLYHTDPVMLLFSLVGILLLLRERKKVPVVFLMVFLIIPFILQSAGAPLAKHFTFMAFILAIPAGYSLNKLMSVKLFNKKEYRVILILILTTVLLSSIGVSYGTPSHYFTKSETSQLKSFINKNVDTGDLIVFDSRIYAARYFWLATDHHFLSFDQFVNFVGVNSNLSQGELSPTRIYIIECSTDDCGWGWVSGNQELNQSSELFLQAVSQESVILEDITSSDYDGNELFSKTGESAKYTIHRANLNLNPVLVSQTDLVNSFYFAPYLYKNMQRYLYNYSTSGGEKILEIISLWIIYFSILVSIISIFYLFSLI